MRALNMVLADPAKSASLKKRFWAKVKRCGARECWPWQAKAVHPFGYGRMTAGRGVNLKAHQIAWALKNGPIPDGMNVLHECDNPWCCNESHLFLGTLKDNAIDCWSKGRGSPPPHLYGERHPRAKLGERDVLEILLDDRDAATIASERGVSAMTIWRLKTGRSWKHLERVRCDATNAGSA